MWRASGRGRDYIHRPSRKGAQLNFLIQSSISRGCISTLLSSSIRLSRSGGSIFASSCRLCMFRNVVAICKEDYVLTCWGHLDIESSVTWSRTEVEERSVAVELTAPAPPLMTSNFLRAITVVTPAIPSTSLNVIDPFRSSIKNYTKRIQHRRSQQRHVNGKTAVLLKKLSVTENQTGGVALPRFQLWLHISARWPCTSAYHPWLARWHWNHLVMV